MWSTAEGRFSLGPPEFLTLPTLCNHCARAECRLRAQVTSTKGSGTSVWGHSSLLPLILSIQYILDARPWTRCGKSFSFLMIKKNTGSALR